MFRRDREGSMGVSASIDTRVTSRESRRAAFADAWIGLSSAYSNFAFYGTLPSAQAFARSDAAARTALTLRPESGLAHAMLAASLAFRVRVHDVMMQNISCQTGSGRFASIRALSPS